ncbi:unnamed protein product [Lathyrus sativus]|nr:unnamed protein product [Lathyrus sativus]
MSTKNTFSIIFCFFSSFIFHTIASPTPTASPTPSASPDAKEIHDLLPDYGFPKGVLPNNVALYTISPSGYFTVHLDSPCYVHTSDRFIYYNTLITGTLTNGSVYGVSGVQTKILFIWLSVTGMKADSRSGMLEFFIGALSKELPANLFQNVPACSFMAGNVSPTAYFEDSAT